MTLSLNIISRIFKTLIPVFVLFLLFPSEALSDNKLNKIRKSYDSDIEKLRIVFDANKKINFKFNKISKKNELSINLRNIRTSGKFVSPKFDRKYTISSKLIKNKNNIKFNFVSSKNFTYKYFILGPKDSYNHRLVVDIYFDKKISKLSKIKNKLKNLSKNKVVIAIDAGHGGRDPGAVGKKGTLEKDIVLSISKKLYSLLKKEKNIKPILIRNKDSYISLRQRINIARRNKADLFISIHADAAKNKKARGSSVYVLSQHGASSEAAKWLANKENSSDLLGGASIDDKDNDIAEVLLDMSQSVTIETSLKASRIMLSKLKKVSKLHSNTTGQAGFVVLKSPDIPSLLIETAFLSNPKEEKKLRTKKFQNKIARAIRDGIIEIIKKGII
jgi:N-acetylmuramoyl-L-alanine amidase